MNRYDTSLAAEREEGIAEASRAVQRLLEAKGRGRHMPPPVLVSAKTTLEALAVGIPEWAHALVEELWPGPLTLVLRQQPSLQWDLGDTRGTVAVRMPDHEVALELLARTGPLAVSSANRTGLPAALDADDAERMLGDQVRVILDAGPAAGPLPSTILDCTGERARVLRQGVLDLERINEVVSPLGAEILDEG